MRKVLGFVVLLVASVALAAPTIDGVIDASEGWQSIGTSSYATGGGDGANLNEFFYYPDNTYLYLAFTTNNTASWDIAYGIGLDYDDTGGYYSGDSDAWGRKLSFDNPPAVEWEFYWWWSGNDGAVTSFNACEWTGSGWNYAGLGTYATSGDGTNGLQTLEYRVAWSDLGLTGSPSSYRLTLWLAGGEGSSAVDVIPEDASVQDGGGSEWTDADTLGATQVAGPPTEVSEANLKLEHRVRPVLNGLVVSGSQPVPVVLYRANGQRVLTLEATGRVDLSHLEPGVYLYRVARSQQVGKVLVLP